MMRDIPKSKRVSKTATNLETFHLQQTMLASTPHPLLAFFKGFQIVPGIITLTYTATLWAKLFYSHSNPALLLQCLHALITLDVNDFPFLLLSTFPYFMLGLIIPQSFATG